VEELVFEEPAELPDKSSPWRKQLLPLVERQGEWARILTAHRNLATKWASEFRVGKRKAPAGRWEFTASPLAGRAEWGVYARYLGPETDAADPSPTTTAHESAGGPARPLAGGRADRNPPAPHPEESRTTSPAAPARRREDRTLVLPSVPGVNAPPAITPGGQPKCARKGCSRPAGKGSPWCVPQRWCEGRAGADVEARKVVDPLKDIVELPAPADLPQSRLMQRFQAGRAR
jgi:hypothetical protein